MIDPIPTPLDVKADRSHKAWLKLKNREIALHTALCGMTEQGGAMYGGDLKVLFKLHAKTMIKVGTALQVMRRDYDAAEAEKHEVVGETTRLATAIDYNTRLTCPNCSGDARLSHSEVSVKYYHCDSCRHVIRVATEKSSKKPALTEGAGI